MSLTNFYDLSEVEAWRQRTGVDPRAIREVRNGLCKRFFPDSELPIGDWSQTMQFHWLEKVKEVDSQLDGATKLLFQTAQGLLIESVVLRIASGRTSLCISSQVGCAAACDFCATAKMGVAKNLMASEIVDQVVLSGQLLAKEKRKIRNIVFMGMGEPFHNEEQLFMALDLLVSPDVFCHPPSRILVSTVGITEGMVRFAERYPNTNLALSLHSVDQGIRESLIPMAKKYPLYELHATIREVNRLQSCSVMVEYLMLKGLNDSESNAVSLIEWLRGLDVHVNLIPYNPIENVPHLSCSSSEAIERFSNCLKSNGLKTTTRYSLGKDIAAACGQLVQQKNRHIAKKLAL